MTWREVIEASLAAHAADDRIRLEAEPTLSHQFITAHGTERMIRYQDANLESRKQTLQRSPNPADSYKLVTKQDGQLIAEVQPGSHGSHPYRLTRYKLVRNGDRWLLDDYLWKCQCENGLCNWCNGTGECAVCDGDSNCRFCQNSAICQLCKGSKSCNLCTGSDMPGWKSMIGD